MAYHRKCGEDIKSTAHYCKPPQPSAKPHWTCAKCKSKIYGGNGNGCPCCGYGRKGTL